MLIYYCLSNYFTLARGGRGEGGGAGGSNLVALDLDSMATFTSAFKEKPAGERKVCRCDVNMTDGRS